MFPQEETTNGTITVRTTYFSRITLRELFVGGRLRSSAAVRDGERGREVMVDQYRPDDGLALTWRYDSANGYSLRTYEG